MPRRLRNAFHHAAFIATGLLATSSSALAQQRTIRVIGDDGQPVAYATVTLHGERPKITNEKGEVETGTASRPALLVDIRRLGYEPWYGTVALGDTTTVARVSLRRLSRRMFTVTVTDSSNRVPWYLRGFYERMLARQRGVGSGVYLTPEEIDKRNINLATALLQGLNGVVLQRTRTGKIVAMSTSGGCQLSVMIDGHRVCPAGGCDVSASPATSAAVAAAAAAPAGAAGRRARAAASKAESSDDEFVTLDDIVGVNEIAAVEVYPRGATVPPSLPTADMPCGLVAVWTGSRKAP
jgi:hypothetical protein